MKIGDVDVVMLMDECGRNYTVVASVAAAPSRFIQIK
jgi:hypothetical protein